MQPIVITDVDDDENKVPFSLPGGVIIAVPRLNFIDDDTHDVMEAALIELDVHQQVVAVSNDIAAAAVGTKLKWQPLLDGTKEKLAELGVEVSRVVDKDGRYDEVVAPTADVVTQLKPFSDERPRALRKRGKDVALAMMKPLVTDEEFLLLERLCIGQLDRMLSQWRKHSGITEGE